MLFACGRFKLESNNGQTITEYAHTITKLYFFPV